MKFVSVTNNEELESFFETENLRRYSNLSYDRRAFEINTRKRDNFEEGSNEKK